jgi:hypothetical protein
MSKHVLSHHPQHARLLKGLLSELPEEKSVRKSRKSEKSDKSTSREHLISHPRYTRNRFENIKGWETRGGVTLPTRSTVESFLSPSLPLHPESAAYLFHINGCSKNLLLYIIIYQQDRLTGMYTFNVYVREQFQEYCLSQFGQTYSDSTITQAHRDLTDHNICQNVKSKQYFINPMLAGGKTIDERRQLIRSYTALLLKKGKDPDSYLYPSYHPKGAR